MGPPLGGRCSTWPGPDSRDFGLAGMLQHVVRTEFARIRSSRGAPVSDSSAVFGGSGAGNTDFWKKGAGGRAGSRSECRAFGKAVNRRDDGRPAKDIALIEGRTNISRARAFHRVRPPKIRVPGTPSSRNIRFNLEPRARRMAVCYTPERVWRVVRYNNSCLLVICFFVA